MNTYELRDTFNTAYGPSTPYDTAYLQHHEFTASDDNAALAYVNTLQDKHDAIYVAIGTSEDYANAPCYAACLYNVTCERIVE